MITIKKSVVYIGSDEAVKNQLFQAAASFAFSVEEDLLSALGKRPFVVFVDVKNAKKAVKESCFGSIPQETTVVVCGLGAEELCGVLQKPNKMGFGVKWDAVVVIAGQRQLTELINAAMKHNESTITKKRLILEKKYRLVHFFHLIQTEPYLDIDALSDLYKVCKRTLRRDLQVYKKLFPALTTNFTGNWVEHD